MTKSDDKNLVRTTSPFFPKGAFTLERMLEARAELGRLPHHETMIVSPDCYRDFEIQFPPTKVEGGQPLAGMDVISLEGMPDNECLIFADRKLAHSWVHRINECRETGIDVRPLIAEMIKLARTIEGKK